MRQRLGLMLGLALVFALPGSAQAREIVDPDGALGPRSRPEAIPYNVYEYTLYGSISPSLAGVPYRVYVPNSNSNTVTVIDPHTLGVIDRYQTGQIPHHVTPSYDLSQLYVNNEGSSTLTVIDIQSGRPSATIPVPFPYNLYFTPDGNKAIVVVERLRRLDFRDPHGWGLLKSVSIPWPGADHLDFSADGRYLLVSTEWSGVVVKVDTEAMEVVGTVTTGGLPIDVRLSPDGKLFYVTDQGKNGVHVIDGEAMKELQFIPTGRGAHGLQVSRDTRFLYVSNRLAGTISVIEFATRQVVANWHVGGSPDMMQLSPDGTQLWMTSRFNGWVIVVNAATGGELGRLYAGPGAHGLSYFPNTGRYSTGHNGVYR